MDKVAQTLRKPNAALVMVPRLGRLTPMTRKLYNVMLYKTQLEIREFEKNRNPISAAHFFSSKLSDLAESITTGESDPKTLAKSYLRELRRTEVDWEAPDTDTGVIWRSMGLVSECALEKREGVVWVAWALPPTLFASISDPDRYTPLDLTQMAKLRSYTAISLYEICSRYRNNPTGVTCKSAPEWWVEALTNAPAVIDPISGKVSRREWRKLKSESVLKAIVEINEKTDLSLELHETKVGKAVTEVQFSVRKKRIEVAPQTTQLSAALAERAVKLDLDLKAVVKLRDSGRTEDQLSVALAQLESRVTHHELAPVGSKLAYFKKLLADSGQYIKTVAGVDEPPVYVQARQKLDVIKTWKDQRRADIKNELLALKKEDQKQYALAALDSLQKSGLATPTIVRKVQAADWSTGPLLSKIVDVYALTKYGPNWDVEPPLTASERAASLDFTDRELV